MAHVIVGTAGHIDHGKTSLLEALTGIDCDRWQEEKRRGITIDLGFAHLERDDLEIGFVDVPGHKRFVDNALAGLGGIRIMLLVVAADEGVKPQTREHLAICSLLRIPTALVALTKTDLVSEELAEMAKLEIEELLAETPFNGATVVPVSSVTGDGVKDLEKELVELARRYAVEEGPSETGTVRLPIDRAFVLQGLGVVVTGTLASGRIREGDTVETAPGRKSARIRSVQVHGHARAEAAPGERTALRLAGVELDEIARGTQLVTPGAFLESTRLAARLELLPGAPKALAGWTPVRVHLFSADRPGRVRPLDGPIEPGQAGLVEVRLAEPVIAVPGDRWICRRLSPARTLGGGEILDPGWSGFRAKSRGETLRALTGSLEDRIRGWIGQAGLASSSSVELGRRAGLPEPELAPILDRLAKNHKILAVSGAGAARRWIVPAAFKQLERKAAAVVKQYFRDHRLAVGMPKAEALQQLLAEPARPLGETYLGWLAGRGVVTVSGDQVNLPGRKADLSNEETELSKKILALFEAGGLAPPSPEDLRVATRAKPQVLDGVVGFHVKRGDLTRLPGDLIIAAGAVAGVRSKLTSSGMDTFSVADFKQLFGLTRKWAIPLLEHLDSIGFTRRVGNSRQLIKKPPKE